MSDIVALTRITTLLERPMAKKKLTKAEREEREAEQQRMLANAQRTRELAERAQAKLDQRNNA